MGDRANIFFRTSEGGVGIYAHWSGLAVADAAMRVVKSKAFRSRLGDVSYALRIGVQTVLEALEADSKVETGFGLWTTETGADDNEYPYVVIDADSSDVYVARDFRKPKKNELVDSPTAAKIRARMQGKPETKAKPKKAARRTKKRVA